MRLCEHAPSCSEPLGLWGCGPVSSPVRSPGALPLPLLPAGGSYSRVESCSKLQAPGGRSPALPVLSLLVRLSLS
eukprot:4481200-Prymnesium_polylepis.1